MANEPSYDRGVAEVAAVLERGPTMDIVGETWIWDEEAAYPNGSLRQSRRFGYVRCPDGKLRRCKLGVVDTCYTIPARMSVRGRTVSGFVYHTNEREDVQEYRFTAYPYRKNALVFNVEFPIQAGPPARIRRRGTSD